MTVEAKQGEAKWRLDVIGALVFVPYSANGQDGHLCDARTRLAGYLDL